MEALGEAMYENCTFVLSCLGAGGAGGGPDGGSGRGHVRIFYLLLSFLGAGGAGGGPDGDPGRGHVGKLYLFTVLFRSWRSWWRT